MFGYFGVVWPAELSEGLHGILLPNLEGERGAVREVLDDWQVLRDDTFVDIIELFNDWSWQIEYFCSWNLKSCSQDGIDDLSCKAILDDMWLDEA